jgi:hypothetical protein
VLEHVLQDSPVEGIQEYVVPPVAVSVVDEPIQIDVVGPTVIVGSEFTLTVTVAVLWQPAALVPTTV